MQIYSRVGKDLEATKYNDYNSRLNLEDYNFNVIASEVIAVLRNMVDNVRWTKEIRSYPSNGVRKFSVDSIMIMGIE